MVSNVAKFVHICKAELSSTISVGKVGDVPGHDAEWRDLFRGNVSCSGELLGVAQPSHRQGST